MRRTPERVTGKLVLPQTLEAPVELGQVVGRYVIRWDETAAVADVTAAESVERLELFDVLSRFVKNNAIRSVFNTSHFVHLVVKYRQEPSNEKAAPAGRLTEESL